MASEKEFYRRLLPKNCVDFTSAEGKKIFSEALASGYMECYFKLMCQLRTQDDLAYCGITSLVIALNALEVDPGRVWKGPWRWYHESMLDCCKPLEIARTSGINTAQFVCLAKCNGLHALFVPSDSITTLEQLREEIKCVARREDVVFIASYSRKKLGQSGDGHFSPIGGYHEGRDMVLILDTARFKYPPHWVSLEELLQAMKTSDSETGQPRGYVLLSLAKDQFVPLLFRPSCALAVDSKKGSLSPELLNFDNEWKSWLLSQSLDQCCIERVIELCVDHLLNMTAQGHFKIGTLCLTMPFRLERDNEGSTSCFIIECDNLETSVKEVVFTVKALLKEMEATKTFKSVEAFLSTKTRKEQEKFLQIVQCHPDQNVSGSLTNAEYCIEEKRQQEGSHQLSCCSGSELAPEPLNGSVEKKSCCGCSFTIKPAHIATMFLFIWPHQEAARQRSKSCNCPATSSGQQSSGFATILPEDSTQPSVGLESSSITLADTLVDFLQADIDASKGNNLKGEIRSMMTKFHEVLHYHN